MYHGCRVGIELTQVEVKFEDLTIRAKVMVGSRALPSVTNAYRNVVEVCSVHCQCDCSCTQLSNEHCTADRLCSFALLQPARLLVN